MASPEHIRAATEREKPRRRRADQSVVRIRSGVTQRLDAACPLHSFLSVSSHPHRSTFADVPREPAMLICPFLLPDRAEADWCEALLDVPAISIAGVRGYVELAFSLRPARLRVSVAKKPAYGLLLLSNYVSLQLINL